MKTGSLHFIIHGARVRFSGFVGKMLEFSFHQQKSVGKAPNFSIANTRVGISIFSPFANTFFGKSPQFPICQRKTVGRETICTVANKIVGNRAFSSFANAKPLANALFQDLPTPVWQMRIYRRLPTLLNKQEAVIQSVPF